MSGELVKTGPNEVFIDLGFDIIKVLSSSIVRWLIKKQRKQLRRVLSSDIFIESLGRRKSSSLRNLVDELGEAVVRFELLSA